MPRLPVSAIDVVLRAPDGADDIALLEGDPAIWPAALRLLARIAARADGAAAGGEAADWAALPVTDFEILLLHLRGFLIGPGIGGHVACPGCGERVEVSFAVADYIDSVRPAAPEGIAAADGFRVLDDVRFRLPSVADVLFARQAARPDEVLRARCLGMAAPRTLARRAERAIARMAPLVSGPVGGLCPGCGQTMQAMFDVPRYVVTELRRRAAGVFADVHLLASAYGWSEATVLALPGARRRHYAELIRQDAHRRALVA